MKERESFSSRLGFVLISAGCAIGLGNVWRFPYITGKYGGAAFVLVYLLFLVILGLPVMVTEFSVGRASRQSIATSFHTLEPKGSKWHIYSGFGLAGNYLLMMFYTSVAGWLVLYCIKMARGDFAGLDAAGVAGQFGEMLTRPGLMAAFMAGVVLVCMFVCSRCLQNGVEKVNRRSSPCRWASARGPFSAATSAGTTPSWARPCGCPFWTPLWHLWRASSFSPPALLTAWRRTAART